jgi:hypothetical protein
MTNEDLKTGESIIDLSERVNVFATEKHPAKSEGVKAGDVLLVSKSTVTYLVAKGFATEQVSKPAKA